MQAMYIFVKITLVTSALIDMMTDVDKKKSILPGDNLMIFQRLRHQLFLSLDDGVAVLNNSLLSEDSIDPVLPISIRKLDNEYYEIFIDGYNICSYGSFQDVAECKMDPRGDSKWILEGDDNSLTIQGRGGCLAKYDPKRPEDNFKHGVRIDFCNSKDEQKWSIQRNLIIQYN